MYRVLLGPTGSLVFRRVKLYQSHAVVVKRLRSCGLAGPSFGFRCQNSVRHNGVRRLRSISVERFADELVYTSVFRLQR